MGRLAIRRLSYSGDKYHFESPTLEDGLVLIEGPNGTGKSTFADLVYFGIGGTVKQFGKKGNEQHKEIREDTNNLVRLEVDINGRRFVLTRRFDMPGDVLVAPLDSTNAQVFPVVRRDDRKIFSDWLLEEIGINVVTLFTGTYRGKLNVEDVFRLVYHDQDPDPSRVFRRSDNSGFVNDSREFRHAIFEILIGNASESYYDALGKLKQADQLLAARAAVLDSFKNAAAHAAGDEVESNDHFLKAQLAEKEGQLEKLVALRAALRRKAPNVAASDAQLTALRQQLAECEIEIANHGARAAATAAEQARVEDARNQLIEEVVRVQKIIHAHETLSLFSPDTCPCCLRAVDRKHGQCICGQDVVESAYQRFFYSPEEYLGILKSKQKNVETVEAAIVDCKREIAASLTATEALEARRSSITIKMHQWAGVGDSYTTELERADNTIVELRVEIESLHRRLEIELRRNSIQAEVDRLRREVERLRSETSALETKAHVERMLKIAAFDSKYTRLMTATLQEVRSARVDNDYEPILNDGEYREASSKVTRRLMYYLTLLSMSLDDKDMPFPRFLLIDTPETAGIDPGNLMGAIAQLGDLIPQMAAEKAQVILTTGVGKFPSSLTKYRVLELSKANKLLKVRPSASTP